MLKRILPHLTLVISVMMLTFLVIDYYNSAMHFIGNRIFNILLLFYSLMVIVCSVFLIAGNRRGK